ncbi:MAG: hypothetical protein RBR81_04670 [Bacteroidales bacterium]|jgi:hypothetical protein|nr:hypothetical protein [Bacteroidales bacterium]
MGNRFFYILLVSVLILDLCSCRRNTYRINVSDINVDIKIKRLEKDLFQTNPEDIPGRIPRLKKEYQGFLQLFSYVINTGDINDPSFADYLTRFCTDRQNNEVYDETMKLYPGMSDIEMKLSDAFRHYLHYFPDRNIPMVYTCISGFNSSIITGDSVLGISLDKYLGADCEYYPMLEIYSYMAARMTPEYIVPDCIYAWGASEWDFESMEYPAGNVLAQIIHEGKLRYFQKCMLPETSDEIIFGFNTDQMRFCRNNEAQMWQYLVEHDLLFRTDMLTIRKLVGNAPFTSYFTNESPGRAAVWTGFRIVESYMTRNSGVSLHELMDNKDVQLIVEKSRYNPQ